MSPPATVPARWAAPYAAAPVDATLSLPGSKSQTNRALVLAALTEGTSTIRGALRARDTTLMATALMLLGASVTDKDGDWAVGGIGGADELDPVRAAAAIDVGNAGTVARFVPPVAALVPGPVHVDGDARIRERPLRPLITALRALGVTIDDGGRGSLPFTVHGTGRVAGGAVQVDAAASSQLVSGLLLAAPRFDAGVEVTHRGAPVPSQPHLDMTVEMLRAAGADVDAAPDHWRVRPGALRHRAWDVEPDLSNAAPFVAAAVVTGGHIRIDGWPATTTQPGGLLPALLEEFGAVVTRTAAGLQVTGPATVHGVDLDLHAASELAPVLAAVAALADGPSRLRGIAHMRAHETDRLAALATEIARLGGEVRELPDGLDITPRPLHGATVHTYDDHRLVMAAAVLALRVEGVVIEDPTTVGKTMPDFMERWTRMLGVEVSTEPAT